MLSNLEEAITETPLYMVKLGKILFACLLCFGVIAGLVWLVQQLGWLN
ncbi:MAG: hypothetical protein ACLFQT_01200 [Thiohalophilus sp.]